VSARSFERLVTLVLLAFATAYLVKMLTYPEGAGQIPAIVAAVMIAALLVQLAASFRSGEGGDAAPAAPAASAAPSPAAPSGAGRGGAASEQHAVASSVAASAEEVSPPEIEPDTYETLIRLRGQRRRLFLAIAVWTLLFYVGALAVGFVATFAVLFAALLIYVRERLVVALVVGALSGVLMYAFVTVFLGLPGFDGFLLR
jgi:hypothetical protein